MHIIVNEIYSIDYCSIYFHTQILNSKGIENRRGLLCEKAFFLRKHFRKTLCLSQKIVNLTDGGGGEGAETCFRVGLNGGPRPDLSHVVF